MIDPNVTKVCASHITRAAFGMSKYGVDTTRTDVDLAGWLRHLQEELMDAAVYIESAINSIEEAT